MIPTVPIGKKFPSWELNKSEDLSDKTFQFRSDSMDEVSKVFASSMRDHLTFTPKKESQESGSSVGSDSALRSSAQKFFELRVTPNSPPHNLSFNGGVMRVLTPELSGSPCRCLPSLDSIDAELTPGQVRDVVESFRSQGVYRFPHYTFDTTPDCRKGISALILDMEKTLFNAASPEKFTVLTWISPSVKKGFIEELQSDHKTIFYVERTKADTFVIVSFDSIEAPTTRRLIQVIRQDLENAKPGIRLEGWTSKPQRQKSLYGCGAFSLDDLVHCHETPNLLDEIQLLPITRYSNDDFQFTLPPEFMVSTQSFTTLIEYLQTVKPVYPPTHIKVDNLYSAVQSSLRLVDGREVNAYIEERNAGFHSRASSTNPKK